MLPSSVSLKLPAWIEDSFDPGVERPDDDAKMAVAIELARRNVRERSGGPFGAALFDAEGRIVSVGVNLVLPQSCSLAHAEIMAFMLAQQHLGRARLNETGARFTLATSAQPCCQCFGAAVWAGIDVLLIGARASDVEALTEFDEGPLPDAWVGELERRGISVRCDIRRDEACAVLREYAAGGGMRY